ncbi:MAG: methyltransferase domain-containing protein [Micavibrio sp.]|nr:methyltransferase domain-containing protein [Micavibrio sp.]
MSQFTAEHQPALQPAPAKTGGRGHDITSKRQDELDAQSIKAVVDGVAAGRPVTVLDLGGGYGTQSVRFAEAGATVTMIDRGDMAAAAFNAAVESGRVAKDKLTLQQSDFGKLAAADVPDGIDVFYSQRAIHYVPYADAAQALSLIFNKMAPGGKAFISAAGFDTEYGKTYPDRDKPVAERYAFLAPDMQEKHDIRHKIVTYSEGDMAELLTKTGFTDVQVTRSDFGNIKAMGRKP